MSIGGRGRVAVIGAGPGGLAVAAELERRGVAATIIDRRECVASQWRRQPDSLSLNTVRWAAHLPGLRFPWAAGRWPGRDSVVAYLERYAEEKGLDLRLGVEVERLDPTPRGWRLSTSVGPIEAPEAIVATGSCNAPLIPAWPGRERFEGELVHAVEYRNASAYRGRDVLVVGAGNSGAEIATDLARGGAARVRLSVRTPPNLLPRWLFLFPPETFSRVYEHLPERLVDGAIATLRRLLVGDLTALGLPAPERGFYHSLLHSRVTPIVDVGLVSALRRGAVEVVPAVERLDGAEVVLAGDGGRLRPDALIAATGYERCLEPLVGHLGMLDEIGMPRAGPDGAAPGLHFIGFSHPSGSSLRELRIDARRLARALVRQR